ncbi:MAG: type II toxin-antitoxin system HicA family toxin [Cyanobacteria bacterium J06621_8]
MPKLPRVTAAETIKTLEKLGFTKIRQRGSHVVMKKQLNDENSTIKGCVVPFHRKTLAAGTLRNILNQAGVSKEEFIDNL